MKKDSVAKKRRKVTRRVDFLGDRTDHVLLTYIGLGYSTRFIQASTGLSPWQISYRAIKLRKLGISRSDYRNGGGIVAGIVMREAQKQIDAALIRHLQAHL